MNSDDPRIQPLPPSVVAKLKSSTTITTLKGVILDLVKNALDANARTVYITVDALRGGCIVEDDGDGIPPFEFHSSGGLGKAHHTSRLGPERDVYGHRGSFLASLSALSMLTITSRHFRHTSTNTLVFHHATPVVRLTPAPSYQGLRSSSHGTSITVNDLFGNLPVRVKSRALALQKSEEVERQWDDLRQLLVPLMLANNQLIKLVVMDASGEKKLSLCPKTLSHEAESTLDLQRINTILYQAGLVEARHPEHWDVVSASVPGFQIQAAISRIPSTTKKVQFLSLGVTPMLPQSSANIFYTEINRLFALSDFDTAKFPAPLRAKDEVLGSGYEVLAKAPPKECTKWPMFYMRITSEDCTSLDCDAQGAPEAVHYVQRILDVLGAMLNEFLGQQGLRPRARKKRKMSPKKGSRTSDHEAQGSDTAYSTAEPSNRHIKVPDFRRPMTVSHHFGNWTRVKSASIISENMSATGRALKPNAPLHRNYLQKPAMPSETAAPNDTNIVQSSGKRSHDEAFVENNPSDGHFDPITSWIDPYTGRTHMINSRTGQSIGAGSPAISLRPRSTGSLWTKRGLEDQDRPKSAAIQPARNAWVENILDDWKPPVFGRPEKAIDIFDINTGHRAVTPNNLFRPDTLGVSKYRGKLRKHDLRKSQIIAQVDRKFILAAIGPSASNSSKTLVLIDQHAADERCRVEALLASFLPTEPTDTPPSVRLDNAIVIEIPPTETSVFKRYRQFYSHWGVEYSIEQRPRDAKAFVFVHALPALIAERCRAEPELVTQLVRGEIWHREESGGLGLPKGLGRGESRPSTRQGAHDGATASDSGWFGRLDTCPRGIIDLLNSRACRTAIMFNDVLTVEECQGLVSRLAGCTFPFQCAHGRPSMIPILDIDASAPDGLGARVDWGQTDEYACNETFNGGRFAEAYQRWQGLV